MTSLNNWSEPHPPHHVYWDHQVQWWLHKTQGSSLWDNNFYALNVFILIDFVSIFTSLMCFLIHLLINACTNIVFCKNTREYTQEKNKNKINKAIVKIVEVIFKNNETVTWIITFKCNKSIKCVLSNFVKNREYINKWKSYWRQYDIIYLINIWRIKIDF